MTTMETRGWSEGSHPLSVAQGYAVRDQDHSGRARMYNVAGLPCSGATFFSKTTTHVRVLLGELLDGIANLPNIPQCNVSGLQLDSRKVQAGDLFCAVVGSREHGLAHARQAIERGAAAIVFDPAGGAELVAGLERQGPPVLLAIPRLGQRLGWIAARFFGHPSQGLDVIGITGTNGKTSCSHFLAQALGASTRCAVMGTLGWGFIGALLASANTTPDAIATQRALATLKRQGAESIAMEVSSHGQVQGRSVGIRFKGAVYTNISRDHLDYHGTMEAYVEAKLSLLRSAGLEFAVINLDDAYAERIVAAVPAGVRVLGFTRRSGVPFSVDSIAARRIRHGADGLSFEVNDGRETVAVALPLVGDFNVENLLATLGVMRAMGLPLGDAVARLSRVRSVAGRMERLAAGPEAPVVVVDYAHTPDALQRLLESVRVHCMGKLWLIFGCGGDRDRGKRAPMGAIAQRCADRVLITDDNPRDEDADAIVQEILAGCPDRDRIEVVRNRGTAIRTVIERAAPEDVVIVAGKGHEGSQEIKGVCYPFSDKQAVLDALGQRQSRTSGRQS